MNWDALFSVKLISRFLFFKSPHLELKCQICYILIPLLQLLLLVMVSVCKSNTAAFIWFWKLLSFLSHESHDNMSCIYDGLM